MKAPSILLSVLFGLVLAPREALADESPRSAVVILDDGDVQGRIVEMKPGESLTLLLPSGEPTVIAWAKVQRIIAVADDEKPAPPSSARPATSPREDGTAVISLPSESGVRLERRASSTQSWERQCSAPCEVVVPRIGSYRVVDANGHALETFSLKGRRNVRLDVRPSSGGVRAIGVVTTVVGGLSVLGGLASESPGWAIFGALLTPAGIVTLLLNRTRVKQTPDARSSSTDEAVRTNGERVRTDTPLYDVAVRRTNVAGLSFQF